MPTRIEKLLGDDLQGTYRRCKEAAGVIIGDGYTVEPVKSQGSQSVTFVGTPVLPRPVVSFRIESGRLNSAVVEMARRIHGDLVPEVSHIGLASSCGPVPLYMYKMRHQSGTDFWSLVGREVRLDEDALAKRTTLVKSLARYVLTEQIV